MATKSRGKRSPSDDRSGTAAKGKGKSANRYTSASGRKRSGAAKRREAVSGGPRRGGRGAGGGAAAARGTASAKARR